MQEPKPWSCIRPLYWLSHDLTAVAGLHFVESQTKQNHEPGAFREGRGNVDPARVPRTESPESGVFVVQGLLDRARGEESSMSDRPKRSQSNVPCFPMWVIAGQALYCRRRFIKTEPVPDYIILSDVYRSIHPCGFLYNKCSLIALTNMRTSLADICNVSFYGIRTIGR